MHLTFGIPYAGTSLFWAVALAVVFFLWDRSEHTLSIHSITTSRREKFYWATIFATFAARHRGRGLHRQTLGLGYLASALFFCVVILIPWVGWSRFRMNEIFAFWFAYVVTRPIGASFADYFSKPKNLSGLGFDDLEDRRRDHTAGRHPRRVHGHRPVRHPVTRIPIPTRTPRSPAAPSAGRRVSTLAAFHKVRAMDTASLLLELYGRIPPLAAGAVDGLDEEELCRRPEPGANPIGWLVWHLARVQDHHVAELLGYRAGLGRAATGPVASGSSPIPPTPATATAPRRSVPSGRRAPTCCSTTSRRCRAAPRHARGTRARRPRPRGGRRWDPPVTLGVRLVSIADDSLQHAGQAAYVRGLLGTERRRSANARARCLRLSAPAAWASGRTPRSGTSVS